MRDIIRLLQIVAIYGAGPDDTEGGEFLSQHPVQQDDDDDFIARDEIDDNFLWLAWHNSEEHLAETLNYNLQPSDVVNTTLIGDQLSIEMNDEKFYPPLSTAEHNSYIIFSSIAHLLRDRYDFWLAKGLMQVDVHAILITTKAESEELMSKYAALAKQYFMPFEIGHDYFTGINIPYSGCEGHNPLFDTQRRAILPTLSRIKEQHTLRGKELLAENKQRQQWLEDITNNISTANIDPSAISLACARFDKAEAQSHKIYEEKIACLRREIAEIIQPD